MKIKSLSLAISSAAIMAFGSLLSPAYSAGKDITIVIAEEPDIVDPCEATRSVVGKIVKQKLTKNIKNDEGFYFVRIGIFSDISNIDNIISQIKNLAKIRIDKSQLGHKVLLGPFANINYTERVLNIIKEKGFEDAIIEKIK